MCRYRRGYPRDVSAAGPATSTSPTHVMLVRHLFQSSFSPHAKHSLTPPPRRGVILEAATLQVYVHIPCSFRRLGLRFRFRLLPFLVFHPLRDPVLWLKKPRLPCTRKSALLTASLQVRRMSYHTQQAPDRLARLRAHAKPVLRPRNVQAYVFVFPACLAA